MHPSTDPLIDAVADWVWAQDAHQAFTLWRAGPLAPVRIDAAGVGAGSAWSPAGDGAFRDVVVRARTTGGGLRYLSFSGRPMGTGWQGIARDITEQASRELRRSIEHHVVSLLAEATALGDAVPRVMKAICDTLHWDCGAFWEHLPDKQVLRCKSTWGRTAAMDEFLSATQQLGTVSNDGRGLVRLACAQREPVWIRNVVETPSFVRAPAAARAGLHSAFAFPVQVAGEVLGVMEFFSSAVHEPDTELLQWAGYIAEQLSRFIQLQRARERLAASESRLRSVVELSCDWVWEQDADFRFTFFEASGRSLERMRAKGWTGAHPIQIGGQRWDMPALNLGEDEWAEHRALLERHEPFFDFEIQRPDFPNGEERWLSVSGAPVFDDSGAFVGYRGVNKDISERKRAEARIEFLANHDPLTGLPNRALFGEILNRAVLTAKRYGRTFAVFFLDLDRFKLINDSLGHDAGDMLLKEIGERLSASVRSSDVVARLGGDEFVVLVQEVEQRADVERVAQNVLSAVLRPTMLPGQEVRISGSIGIAMFKAHGEDAVTLMKNADVAMYQAKEEGKNQYRFYNEKTQVQTLERMALESSLRQAIDRGELFLHYQAKQDLRSKRVSGVEALLRWRHPELGVVPPLKFIPLAEETGLVVPIGKWVLQTACRQAMEWQRQGFRPMCMAINLSARQFADDNLLVDVRQALLDSRMAPELLELELTESMVIQHPERALALLDAIKQMGVRIAIDDFGTGYSSLTQLKTFPIDTLKVDRSFIRDLQTNAEDRAMTKAIIAMGKTLGLTVVAEGVETGEQQAFLGANDCDEIQGYYFSKPLPPEELPQFLQCVMAPADS